MPGRILQDDIEALKQRADLADVVSDQTRLKRAGARLKGLCPFHQERTPSFTVDPARGVWHCFGCGAGGDVYSFLMQSQGLSFVEAVEQLARRTGFTLRYEELSAGQRRALGERSRLVGVTTAALEFFRRQLYEPGGAVARDYLKGRGFTREDAERFLVGFAPLEWDALSRHLLRDGVAEADIERAGLALRNARGGLRDRFRGRLIFPVLDPTGDVIGFGGRVLPGLDYGEQEPPKYYNSPETPLYRKQRVLYGLSWARPEIVRTGEVLVCEGYTDVMALHQAGVTNAVATCGTAVGEEHLRLLGRYAERVVLAFDADAAGEKAAERAWELARGQDLELRVLVMPPGRDPADTVREGGADAMRALVADAEPVLRFMLRRVTAGRGDSPEARAAAADAAAALLATVDDPVLRDQYVRFVANDLVGLSVAVVSEVVERARGAAPAADAVPAEPPSHEPPARARLEREVLRVVVQRPDLLPDRWDEVEERDFTHPRARTLFDAVVAAGGPGVPLDQQLEAAPDDEVRSLLRTIALEDFTVEPDRPHVEMLVGQLLLRRVERAIEAKRSVVQRLNPVADPDTHLREFEELIALEARRRELRELVADR